MVEDMREFGMPAEQLARFEAALRARIALQEYCGVWPAHVAIVEAFYAVDTQWRTSLRGGGGFASMFGGSVRPVAPMFLGLDYAGVRIALDALGTAVTAELWAGLRIMELAACAELNRAFEGSR